MTLQKKKKKKIMPLSVFYFGEFQVFLFLFRVVLTALKIQGSGSSSQVTLQSILQLHAWRDQNLECLFPLVPKLSWDIIEIVGVFFCLFISSFSL